MVWASLWCSHSPPLRRRRLSWRRRRAVSTHKEASNRDYKRCPRGKNRVIPLCLPPNSFRGRMQGTLEAIFFLIWDHKWRQRRDVMMHGTLNFLYPLAIKLLKFIYSEKATKICKIFVLLLTTVHTVKSKLEISQNFVAFSEYMNFGR